MKFVLRCPFLSFVAGDSAYEQLLKNSPLIDNRLPRSQATIPISNSLSETIAGWVAYPPSTVWAVAVSVAVALSR